jgi:CobQ-like glutamine amidotransferase family enzyme
VAVTSAVRIALLYPDLLGTYGDSGNAVVLAQRLRWRGHPAEVTTVLAGDVVPASCDLYIVGGGEDMPQALAARQLGRPGPLHRAVEGGAAVLAICAGLQILGTRFVGPDGVETAGLGLLDCRSVRGTGRRAVGELVVDPDPESGLPTLTGYENHGGRTLLGPDARPAGRVRTGVGNGDGAGLDRAGPTPRDGDLTTARGPEEQDGTRGREGKHEERGTDGVWTGRIWGTYLHGPVLARNPALADLLLGWVVGDLEALDDRASEALRAERLIAAPSEASARDARRGVLGTAGALIAGGRRRRRAVTAGRRS